VPLVRQVVRYYQLLQESGVLVIAVEPGSPAQAAGLAEGDIIIRAGEHGANSVEAIQRVLTQSTIGAPLPLTVLRGTELVTLTACRPNAWRKARLSPSRLSPESESRTPNPELRRRVSAC